MSAVQLSGVGVAVAGLVVASSTPAQDPAPARRSATTSLTYGLISAIGFGTFFIATDTASHDDVGWALLLARATGVTVLVAVVVSTRHPTHRHRHRRRRRPGHHRWIAGRPAGQLSGKETS